MGAVLHEVNNKPAISIYEDYFGAEEAAVLKTESLAKLATYPLGLKVEVMSCLSVIHSQLMQMVLLLVQRRYLRSRGSAYDW